MKTSSKRRNTISNNFLLCYLSNPSKSFLPNQTFQTKLSKPNIPNLQTYQTKPRRVKDAQKKGDNNMSECQMGGRRIKGCKNNKSKQIPTILHPTPTTPQGFNEAIFAEH